MSFEALATIAEAAPVLLLTLDAEGQCRWCNRAWCDLTGRSVEATAGVGWFQAIHPDDRGSLEQASRQDEPFEAELRIRRADGRYRACLARAAPWLDGGATFVGHILSATDVTELAGHRRVERTGPVSHVPQNEPIRLRLPARADQLAVVRRLLAGWLEATGIAAEDIGSVVLAVSEAASNAIEHAYGPAGGWFELEGAVDGRRLTVMVRDGGRWRYQPPGAGGRGLGLMARLMDEFETRRSEEGTEVWMRRTLVGKDSSR